MIVEHIPENVVMCICFMRRVLCIYSWSWWKMVKWFEKL